MGTGDRSILVHGLPENLPMANHTHGRIDFGGLFDHYNSDVARTFIIGEPNAKHVDVFDRMMEVYVAAVEACQLGAPANSVYFTAKAMSEKMGLPFNRVHSGHGLGLSVHEYPMLAPGNEITAGGKHGDVRGACGTCRRIPVSYRRSGSDYAARSCGAVRAGGLPSNLSDH